MTRRTDSQTQPAARSGLFDVRQFGATGDGQADDGPAIAAAIGAASAAGGGTVHLPAGRYVTGTVELASNITLHLDAGATILGSERAGDYPLAPAETIPGWNQDVRRPLIWALDAENVAITGRGAIDGRGWTWWRPTSPEVAGPDGKRLPEVLRPRLIELLRCTNVRIAGVTLRNSPSWTVHPLCCENVAVDGITICNPPDSPNTDGVNPEACRNVRIANCHIDVGDDCITIKSGKEDQPLRSSRPCENVTVTGCTMIRGHGGVVIGSEMAGGVRHVAIGNCVFNGTDRGIRIKTRRGRGNAVENVTVSNIAMTGVRSVVQFTMFYAGTHLDPGPDAHRVAAAPVDAGTPQIRNIRVSDVTADDCEDGGYLAGLPEMPIANVSFSDVRISARRAMFAARVAGLSLNNVQIAVAEGPAIVCENVRDLDLCGLRLSPAESAAAVELTDVAGAHIRDCRGETATLVSVAGADSADIALGAGNRPAGATAVRLADDVAPTAVEKV